MRPGGSASNVLPHRHAAGRGLTEMVNDLAKKKH